MKEIIKVRYCGVDARLMKLDSLIDFLKRIKENLIDGITVSIKVDIDVEKE